MCGPKVQSGGCLEKEIVAMSSKLLHAHEIETLPEKSTLQEAGSLGAKDGRQKSHSSISSSSL